MVFQLALMLIGDLTCFRGVKAGNSTGMECLVHMDVKFLHPSRGRGRGAVWPC